MSIEYTYEIIFINEMSRNMEVVYSSEGYESMHVGVRIPYVGETLEDVIKAYSPVSGWIEQQIPLAVPAIGTKGTLTYEESFSPPQQSSIETPAEEDPIRVTVLQVLDELNLLPDGV